MIFAYDKVFIEDGDNFKAIKLSPPTVNHSNPSDYGLTYRVFNKQIAYVDKLINKWKQLLFETEEKDQWYIYDMDDRLQEEKKNLDNKKKYYKSLEKYEEEVFIAQQTGKPIPIRKTIDLELLRAISIKEILAGYSHHEKRPNQYICPFHNEKTPSMFIKNNKFKCYGCQANGSVIDLVMGIEKISTGDAIKLLNKFI